MIVSLPNPAVGDAGGDETPPRREPEPLSRVVQLQPRAPTSSFWPATPLVVPLVPSPSSSTRERNPSSLSCAKLLARVFSIDVTVCRRCGSKVRVVAAIADADEIARLLHGARPPARPSPPGQQSFLLA